jgi:hypothetical protein
MRRATKALLFASVSAQAEWATAPDTRHRAFRPHRAAPRSTPETVMRSGRQHVGKPRFGSTARDHLTRSAQSHRASGWSSAPFPGLVETGGSPRISRT